MRRRIRGILLAAACLVAGGLGAEAHHAATTGAGRGGALAGRVKVFRKQPLLGVREASDHAGALVYVTGFTRSAPARPALLEQRGEQFEPRILPIVSGQTVRFPNHDRIYHNVFSVSPVQSFDLGQYKSTDAPRDVRFERSGLVPVFCNIHPQMLSYVVVLENDAFALSAADGSFEIDGLPAGAHTLNAWIPGAQRVSQPIEVMPGETLPVELVLEQTERIAPHKRKDGSDYPKPRYEEP
jgi:plastocyanin